MAEVYVIGEVAGGSGFSSNNLFCKWNLKVGSTWKVIEGAVDGQTQVDHPKVKYDHHFVFMCDAGYVCIT